MLFERHYFSQNMIPQLAHSPYFDHLLLYCRVFHEEKGVGGGDVGKEKGEYILIDV